MAPNVRAHLVCLRIGVEDVEQIAVFLIVGSIFQFFSVSIQGGSVFLAVIIGIGAAVVAKHADGVCLAFARIGVAVIYAGANGAVGYRA